MTSTTDPYHMQAQRLLASHAAAEARALMFGDTAADRRLATATARALGERAVYIPVPDEPDRVPYVWLAIGEQCGLSSEVADHLRRGRVEQVAEALTAALDDRVLILAGIDRLRRDALDDLPAAFEREREAIRRWLYRHTGGDIRADRSIVPAPQLPSEGDVATLWSNAGRDVDLFKLALVRHGLLGDAAIGSDTWDTNAIADEIWTALPEDLRVLVRLLVVHGRPIGRGVLLGLGVVSAEALDEASRIHLLDQVRDQVMLESSFVRPLIDHLGFSSVARSRQHRILAEAFATHAMAQDAPASHLEAQRHFAAAGDLRRAAEFARFSVAMLLDGARRASRDAALSSSPTERREGFTRAIEGYDAVRSLAEQTEIVPSRARAYATHYRHYNRYKSGEESSAQTIEGYREALGDWPENARFWSRIIRANAVDGRLDAAEVAQQEAYRRVPEHPERDALLLWQVVERLSARGLWLPALALSDNKLASYAGRRLVERLARGVRVGSLEAQGGLAVMLAALTPFVLVQSDDLFHAVVPGREAVASSARGAVAKLVRALGPSQPDTGIDLAALNQSPFELWMSRVRRAWGHSPGPARIELTALWREAGLAGLSWLVWRVTEGADPDELTGAFDLLCASGAAAVPFVLAALDHPVKSAEGLTMLLRVLAWLPNPDEQRVNAIVERLARHPNEDVQEARAELVASRSSAET